MREASDRTPHRRDGRGAVARRPDLSRSSSSWSMPAKPKVLFVPTAAGDRPVGARVLPSFPAHSFEPSDLGLFARTVEDSADVRAVPGRRLRGRRQHAEPARDLAGPRARRDPAGGVGGGVVLAGGSAGANCWFEASTTDSSVRATPTAARRAGAGAGELLPALRQRARRQPAYQRAGRGRRPCRPGSRATTSLPCTSWAPISPRSWSSAEARALGRVEPDEARRRRRTPCRPSPAALGGGA